MIKMNKSYPLQLIAILMLLFAVLPAKTLLCSELSLAHKAVTDAVSQAKNNGAATSQQFKETEKGGTDEQVFSSAKPVRELGDNLVEDVPGPGALLGKLLRQLSLASIESDDRIKGLIAGIPQIVPDLKNVLIAL